MGARPRNTRMEGANSDTTNGGNWKKPSIEIGKDYWTYCHRKNRNYINCFLRLGTCYNCGKGGHLSFECLQKKRNFYSENGKYTYKRENNYGTSSFAKQRGEVQ